MSKLSKSHSQLRSRSPTKSSLLKLWNQKIPQFEISSLKNLKDRFKKDIQIPIEYQSAVFASKTPQRCLMHNNFLTLYCINDQKAICVTCNYQTAFHRKHKVIPLTQADYQMEEDTQRYLKVVYRELDVINQLAQRSTVNLQRVDQDFQNVISRVNQFYNQLNDTLIIKKNQNIKHIKYFWARLKFQYFQFQQELTSIDIFCKQKIAEVKERMKDINNRLFNRNILQTMAKLQQFIDPQMCEYHGLKYMDEIKRFSQVSHAINDCLAFSAPVNDKETGNYRATAKTSSRRKSLKKTFSKKTIQRSITPNNKTTQHLQSPKNIHSTYYTPRAISPLSLKSPPFFRGKSKSPKIK